MTIGERIHFIRNLRNMTQKELGKAVGFSENTADARMAQYETGSRTPKEALVQSLSDVLDVSPLALKFPISTATSVSFTPCLLWKICMASKLNNMAVRFTSSLTVANRRQLCSQNGLQKPKCSETVKSARKNTTVDGTITHQMKLSEIEKISAQKKLSDL